MDMLISSIVVIISYTYIMIYVYQIITLYTSNILQFYFS